MLEPRREKCFNWILTSLPVPILTFAEATYYSLSTKIA